MNDFKKLLGAKKTIDPVEKEAKLSAIKGMKKMAGDMMADDMKSMKKVTVAAPDEQSLEAGLDKAKEIVGNPGEMSEYGDSEDMPDNHMEEMIEEMQSPEEIDELMQKLMEKKAALAKV